jgi:DNA-binding NarL/FixJ family response regulator
MNPDTERPVVVIADDHPLLRDALARTLLGVLPDARVVEADGFDAALAALTTQPARLAIVDLHMPGMAGAEGVQALKVRFPALPLVVASGDDDPAVIRAVLAAGAAGFLPKSEPAPLLQQALRLVLDGGRYTPPRALADLDRGAAAPPVRADDTALTPRQRDVLRCLMRGEPNKLIARELGLTEGTVKIHIAAILRTLQARNRTEAVVIARRLGLDDDAPG